MSNTDFSLGNAENDRLRAELNGLQRSHDQLADQYAGVVAERDRLREALTMARAELADWIETYSGGPDWPESTILERIDAALAKEAGE